MQRVNINLSTKSRKAFGPLSFNSLNGSLLIFMRHTGQIPAGFRRWVQQMEDSKRC